MRWGLALLVGLSLAGRTAHADDVDDLVAKGQQLAQQSEYTQAISLFKQADAKRPRAAHACMIGLAYMRREAWPQAELFLALCEKRAVPGDQPPDWIDEAEKQLAQKLSAAQIPAVTIEVTPANIGARLTVSSFAPDEVFDPQTIHLAPGKHVIEVTAPGFKRAEREVVIEPATPQKVTFELEPDGSAPVVAPQQPPPLQHLPDRVFAPRTSPIPWVIGGVGVALVAIGGVYDLTSVSSARSDAEDAQTGPARDYYLNQFHDRRSTAVVLYGLGAVAIGVGVALHYTVFKSGPQLSAQLDAHGGGIFVGWQR